MRPEEHRSKLAKAARAHCRTHLKDTLGFLPGFPVGLQKKAVIWQPLPRLGSPMPDEMRLDGESLRQAAGGWNKIDRHFPRAFPKVVADAHAWKRSVPVILSVLTRGVHDGVEPPPLPPFEEFGLSETLAKQAVQFAGARADTRPFVHACAWAMCLDPQDLRAALSWLQRHSDAVANIMHHLPGREGVLVALALFLATQTEGDQRVSPLLEDFECANPFAILTQGVKSYLEQLVALLEERSRQASCGVSPFPRPILPEWAKSTLEFSRQIILADPLVRKRALDLRRKSLPPGLLARWTAWWRNAEPATEIAIQFLRSQVPPGASKASSARCGELIIHLRALQSELPPETPSSERRPFADTLLRLSRTDSSLFNRLMQMIERFPLETGGRLPRVEFLQRCASFYEPALDWLLRMLSATDLSWELLNLVLMGECYDLDEPDLDTERTAHLLRYWMKDLRERSGFFWPACLSRAGIDMARARSYLAAVAACDSQRLASVFPPMIRLAIELRPAPEHFVAVIEAIQRGIVDEGPLSASMSQIARKLCASGWNEIIVEELVEGGFSRFRAVLDIYRLASALRVECDPPPYPAAGALGDWAARFPPELQPSLALVAGVVDNPEAVAERAVAGCIPSSTRLESEIRGMESRLETERDNPRFARRLENLRNRLAQPSTPTSAQLQRANLRLRRAVGSWMLEDWQQSLRDRAFRKARELLSGLPDWFEEPRHQMALAAVLRLRAPFRELGLGLLRMRCGPPPWDMLGEPANERFVERLRGLGIDPEPWIHPPSPWTEVTADGRKLTLGFERDPLEILQMGSYFHTCLSVGSFNFFSAVSNAVDANKQVVYARDDRGQVAGRCLLAVTTEGGILVFHPFNHEPAIRFGEMISALANRLAGAMKTAVVKRGTVENLVAPVWYDDGPIDLNGSFPWAEERSRLRRSLLGIELDAVLPAIEDAIKPLRLNGITLSVLLGLTEFDERPEAVLPLLPTIEKSAADLEPQVLARAIELVDRAGERYLAARLIEQRLIPKLAGRYRHRLNEADFQTLTRLTAIAPTPVLRLMRATRERGVRSDQEEHWDARRQVIAAAHRALGRPQKAAALVPPRKRGRN